jgi:ABC-type Zn uptake system ZnuABC Zn-binding protein ZnuA
LSQSRQIGAAFLSLVLLALAIAGCGGSDSDSGDRLDVVATTTQIGDWVREVGGDAVSVDQVLQPNTDPHDYEPRPSDVAAAADASVVFASGEGLDSWIEEIVSDSGSDAEVIDLGALVPERLAGEDEHEHDEHGEEEHADEEDDHHHDSEYDPHWWHDPRNAEAAVREIERALSAADPAHRALFRRNAEDYLRRLARLDAGIARCLDQIPPAERKLVTDHDAFGYFAHRYGIDVVGAVVPAQTTRAQASAKDVSELVDLIEREGVKAVFPESSLSASVAEAVARQTGASADYELYGDTLGPEGSPGATYIGMEAANAEAMARGFSDGRVRCQLSP